MNEEKRRTRVFLAALCFVFALAVCGVEPAYAGEAMSGGGHSGKEVVRQLVPAGHTIGVKLFAEGVLVVGLSDGDTPARQCGLREGDIMLAFNGVEIESTEHLQRLLSDNGAARATMRVQRGAKTLTMPVTPEEHDGTCRLGAWIRDSMAGIGTMTFYDPERRVFGALGHGVSDVDTGQLMPLQHGSVMDARVKAVRRGESGAPGELRGDFDLTRDSGSLYANTESGLFGTITGETNALTERDAAVPVAPASEVRTGGASIRANCAGDEVKTYSIEIERIYPAASPTRNMLLRVTDSELLETTGGIVQGMSGAPILQDGRLVGAVTHVLVNDPTRGYGIFIENMLDAAGLTGE